MKKTFRLLFIFISILISTSAIADNGIIEIKEASALFYDENGQLLGNIKGLPQDYESQFRQIFIPVPKKAVKACIKVNGFSDDFDIKKLRGTSEYVESPGFIGFVYFYKPDLLAISP